MFVYVKKFYKFLCMGTKHDLLAVSKRINFKCLNEKFL
jgi:hypothetical protein